MKRKWIQDATEHGKGKFSAKAKKAGMTTGEYADEKYSAPGKLGKEAREAKTLMAMHKAKGGKISGMKKDEEMSGKKYGKMRGEEEMEGYMRGGMMKEGAGRTYKARGQAEMEKDGYMGGGKITKKDGMGEYDMAMQRAKNRKMADKEGMEGYMRGGEISKARGKQGSGDGMTEKDCYSDGGAVVRGNGIAVRGLRFRGEC